MTPPLTAIAATTAVTTATATATTVASSAVATSAATAGWARLSRPGLVNRQCPSFYRLAIEFGDGILGVLLRTHRNKSKATRLAGEFILHEGDFLHGASL